MRLRRMLCHLPGGDAMAENSLSFGCWARTASSELRPPSPEAFQVAALARVAFHPTCGRPDRAGMKEKHRKGSPQQHRIFLSAEKVMN